ncbi:hypothetical protein NPIL_203971 [Nephila pilipes]|uniref:Uncharacterized protein n=1 Tax=Nephila pilipes TaxID=299642 RepID=A0A8X6P892_NEPPI|nr:hypothetical protein NPIL_203971 [Nephila pilipes]
MPFPNRLTSKNRHHTRKLHTILSEKSELKSLDRFHQINANPSVFAGPPGVCCSKENYAIKLSEASKRRPAPNHKSGRQAFILIIHETMGPVAPMAQRDLSPELQALGEII